MTYFNSPWFIKTNLAPNAKFRLFCFHYAGGNASIFYEWAKALPANLEIIAIQLPGRENRSNELLLKSHLDVTEILTKEFRQFLDKPYIFFGYSLGALLSYELARILEHDYASIPARLIVAAAKSPQYWPDQQKISHLSDDLFISALGKSNSALKPIINNKKYLNPILPILKADFSIVDNYYYMPGDKLSCPITAIAGRKDPLVSASDMLAWQAQTKNQFNFISLPGDHFFISKSKRCLLAELNNILSQHLV